MKKWFYRIVAMCALVVAVPALSGCFGRFPLTKAIYEFNDELGDESRVSGRLFESFMFWILSPIYGLALLGDTLVINLIEFWTGEPMDIGSAIEREGTSVALLPGENENEAILMMMQDGRVVREERLVRISSTEIEIRNTEKEVLGRLVRNSDGDIQPIGSDGELVSAVSNDTLMAAMAR
jgi:hypothetical protein